MRKLTIILLVIATASAAFAEHVYYDVVRQKFRRDYDISFVQQWKGPGFGIVVTKVDSGSPGERLGITKGDLIYEMDGKPIRSAHTWAAIRNGRECEITVYKAATRTTVKYSTGKGMLGVELNDFWIPQSEYVKASGMKNAFDWDVVLACRSAQKDELHMLDEALARVLKESLNAYPLPELEQILNWNEDPASITREGCQTALKAYRQGDLTPLSRNLGRRMIANGFYKEFIELSRSYPGIVAGDTEYALAEFAGLQHSEDALLSARVDEIEKLDWQKAKKVHSENEHTPQSWLDAGNAGNPFDFSVASAHYNVIVSREAAHNDWIHMVLRYDDADDEATTFAKAVKPGFVVSKDEKDNKARIHVTMQTDGTVVLNLHDRRLTYFYAGYKANNKQWITVDLIVYHDQWFYLINGKELARGPITNPVRKDCMYIPYIHFSGVQGEVKTLELRTLEEK